MAAANAELLQDVMQVCRNGHVITDLARTYPERRLTQCDRCGADTLDRCPTCAAELPGAVHVPGLAPVGARRAPGYCAVCGAAFPWAKKPRAGAADPSAKLDGLLRRLPLVVRQLRWRQGDRPPFRVEDEKDLEDLLRALLPLHFDDVRLEGRTPRYAPGTRTDFLLAPEQAAVTAKLVRPGGPGPRPDDQLREDAEYYCGRPGCRVLYALVYDPEGLLHEPRLLETAWSNREAACEVRCVISTPGAAPPAGA